MNENITNNFLSNTTYTKDNKLENNYYLITKKIDKKEFLKELYIAMSFKLNTPKNILDAKFENIKCDYTQYMVIDSFYNGFYSVDIGTEKIVKWEGKTETVIDWKSTNGTISNKQLSCVDLTIENDQLCVHEFCDDIQSLFANGDISLYNSIDSINVKTIKPTNKNIELAHEKGKIFIEESILNSLPRHYKNLHTNMSPTDNDYKFYIIPRYSVKYSLEDTEGEVFCLAYNKKRINGYVPDTTKHINNHINLETKSFADDSILVSILCIIASIATALLIRGTAALIIEIICFILPIVFCKRYENNYTEIKRNYKSDIIEYKKQKLIEKLKNENLEPLTQEELNEINKLKEEYYL